jgi:hypothetical protein
MFEIGVDEVAGADVAALAAALLSLSERELLGGDIEAAQAVVAATQRVLNAVSAVQLLGIEAWSRRSAEQIATDQTEWAALHPGRSYPGPRDEHEFMDADLAPVLHVAPRTAQRTYDTARTVCALLPATLAAMRAGHLEPYRAAAIAEEVPRLRPEICTQVETALFPAVLDLPTARVRAATRRAVAAADPDEVARRATRARADRYVLLRPGPDPGMSEWLCSQPAATSAAAWAAIDELAHSYVADGEHRSLDQARADAMIDLILGQATITTTLTLTLPATLTLRGDSGNGCSCGGDGASAREGLLVRLPRIGIELPRVGLLPTTDLALLLSDPDTRIRPALHDPTTGTLTDLATRTYQPHAATARYVRTRDGTCRFPGCATPARRCHLDHITTFHHGGPTHPPNLITLCQRHHRLKHHGGWTLTMTPTGTATWTNGIGQQYRTQPLDHRPTAA